MCEGVKDLLQIKYKKYYFIKIIYIFIKIIYIFIKNNL